MSRATRARAAATAAQPKTALLSLFLPQAQRHPAFWAKSGCKSCNGSGFIHFATRHEVTLSAEHGVQRRQHQNQSAPCSCAQKRFDKAMSAGQVLRDKFRWSEITG
jgi:hypothetical protein